MAKTTKTTKKAAKTISKKPFRKLTQKKADKIRKLYASGKATQVQLAKRFGCNQPNISAVVNGYTWLR